MQAARRRGEDLGLSEEELAFYDALETNDSAVQVLVKRLLRRYGYPPAKPRERDANGAGAGRAQGQGVGVVGKKGRAARGSDTVNERQEATVRAPTLFDEDV